MKRPDKTITEKVNGPLPEWPQAQKNETEPKTAPKSPEKIREIRRRAESEMDELTRENRWEAMIERFHPVGEKLAVLVAARQAVPARSKIAFALGQAGQYDEAIAELRHCVEVFPGNFAYRSALAYNAYNALWAAKNREIVLTGDQRRERIRLAHDQFRAAQDIRPDDVTVFYRDGMLFSKIEDAPHKGLPKFLRAIANWRGLEDAVRERRHGQRKNYIKALYQAASCALKLDNPEKALELISDCLAEDAKTDYMNPLFKYFALGKVQFHRGAFAEARDALAFALERRRKNQPADFAHELLGRVLLAMDTPDDALAEVRKIPEKRRRPYVRWTEADVLSALDRADEAREILLESAKRDNRSRHKSLIRLAKIEYNAGEFEKAMTCAKTADAFFREKWGNCYLEGCFWRAKAALGMGRTDIARKVAERLAADFPNAYRTRSLLAEMGMETE